MNRFFRLVVLWAIPVLISACAAGTPTSPSPTATPQPAATGALASPTGSAPAYPGYPGPPSPTSPVSGYPGAANNGTPEPPTPVPATPTSDPSRGSAVGVIRLKGKPVTNVSMYLGQLLKDNNGQETIIAMDPIASPWASTDSNGHFQIVNVPPGRYGLVLVTTNTSVDLLYPDKHESIIVTIAAGKQVDLGVLDYVALPVPSS